ncbi:hypothetical protein HDC94_001618 [Leifsonia sp. AK011]|uniref:anti-sigma factor n=1 Tax=Leifsonia sp. AK011 TaxID=2723075 RepID=UPI0015CD4EB3|nr:anti-sigma factor [Leifsonia sp. AK011]NYF10462.1 hypothetical protein [Leifsonia sp. AK011]
MQHIDPDVLALLALGEGVADDADRAHLAGCPACTAELTKLSRAAQVGRSTLDAELLTPAPRVWERIAEEVAATTAPSGVASDARTPPVPRIGRRAGRGWAPFAIAAAVVGLLAVGGLAAWQTLRPAASVVVASATLDAFPAWPDATGKAVVEESADGARFVRVTLDVPEDREGYTEVWLISSDATRLISLGTVEGNSGTLPIPAGVDLSVYDLVDVSAEPLDGDPSHSGDSIVRGQLSA